MLVDILQWLGSFGFLWLCMLIAGLVGYLIGSIHNSFEAGYVKAAEDFIAIWPNCEEDKNAD